MRGFVSSMLCFLLSCSLFNSSSACTSFCLDTADGPIFAINLDLITGEGLVFVNPRGLEKASYFAGSDDEAAGWTARYGSVTFNLAGRELPWSGVNEAGLVVGSMQLSASKCPAPDDRPPFGEGNFVQYLLDTCGSTQEAVSAASLVRLVQHECSTHYLVADEDGECAAIEFLDGRFVSHSGESLPVKALANAPYAAGVAYMVEGVVPAENPGRSVERVAAAEEQVKRFRSDLGVSPVDYSLAILTETVVAPRKWWSDWFDEPYTRWNVVFDIESREVHFRTVASPTSRRLSLHELDFSCEAPLLMLDVNAELEGAVEAFFQPYDHDTNLSVFRTFCDKWGIELSKEEAVGLVRFFESFECTSGSP